MIAIAQPCIVTSLLVAVLLAIFDRGFRVLDKTIELFNFVGDVLRVLVKVLSFFASLLH